MKPMPTKTSDMPRSSRCSRLSIASHGGLLCRSRVDVAGMRLVTRRSGRRRSVLLLPERRLVFLLRGPELLLGARDLLAALPCRSPPGAAAASACRFCSSASSRACSLAAFSAWTFSAAAFFASIFAWAAAAFRSRASCSAAACACFFARPREPCASARCLRARGLFACFAASAPPSAACARRSAAAAWPPPALRTAAARLSTGLRAAGRGVFASRRLRLRYRWPGRSAGRPSVAAAVRRRTPSGAGSPPRSPGATPVAGAGARRRPAGAGASSVDGCGLEVAIPRRRRRQRLLDGWHERFRHVGHRRRHAGGIAPQDGGRDHHDQLRLVLARGLAAEQETENRDVADARNLRHLRGDGVVHQAGNGERLPVLQLHFGLGAAGRDRGHAEALERRRHSRSRAS